MGVLKSSEDAGGHHRGFFYGYRKHLKNGSGGFASLIKPAKLITRDLLMFRNAQPYDKRPAEETWRAVLMLHSGTSYPSAMFRVLHPSE